MYTMSTLSPGRGALHRECQLFSMSGDSLSLAGCDDGEPWHLPYRLDSMTRSTASGRRKTRCNAASSRAW